MSYSLNIEDIEKIELGSSFSLRPKEKMLIMRLKDDSFKTMSGMSLLLRDDPLTGNENELKNIALQLNKELEERKMYYGED